MLYRPEIDGLRALAVIPVVFFHAGFILFLDIDAAFKKASESPLLQHIVNQKIEML
tara:strand:- start:263 stop:430 length:168 start_codon:yes stop_codon:yes gene_type:complete